MLARWKVIDENFTKIVKNQRFLDTPSFILDEYQDIPDFQASILSKENFINLFTIQMYSRHLDLTGRALKEKDLSFYTIGSSGHEGNAGFSFVFSKNDPALLHYRSAAFVLYRAFKEGLLEEELEHQLLSIMASKYDKLCSGRHKVFGDKSLNILPQTSTISSHLPKSVGLALSIEQNKKNKIESYYDSDAVIICSFGDASVNHSTAQGAFNAVKYLRFKHYKMPIIFICEDNQIGISTPTPKKWIQELFINDKQIHYVFCNGLDLKDIVNKSNYAYKLAKVLREPVFLHMKTVRLMGHAGSDIQKGYMPLKEIELTEAYDPLLFSAKYAIENNYLSNDKIITMYEDIRDDLNNRVNDIFKNNKHFTMESKNEVLSSIIPNKNISREENKITWGNDCNKKNKINLAEAINITLSEALVKIKETIILGEDVGNKGGVYTVTKNLQKKYGSYRVFDTLLDEQTILGTAIGLSLNNFLPIPEIQFLAYVHNAIDQIRGEAATLSFFSNGNMANPMVIRIPSFAYQKGFGGHFHNENSIASLCDIPGIIVAAPSNPKNAALLLRECIEKAYYENRVCIFLEPIALYFTKDLFFEKDGLWLESYPDDDMKINLGQISVENISTENENENKNINLKNEITLISYSNGYYQAIKAAKILADEYGFNVKLININWLNPLPIEKIIINIINDKNIILIDECRNTGSILKGLNLEIYNSYNDKNIKLITAEDSFIPLGISWQYLLPSYTDIINTAIKMCELKESIEI